MTGPAWKAPRKRRPNAALRVVIKHRLEAETGPALLHARIWEVAPSLSRVHVLGDTSASCARPRGGKAKCRVQTVFLPASRAGRVDPPIISDANVSICRVVGRRVVSMKVALTMLRA